MKTTKISDITMAETGDVRRAAAYIQESAHSIALVTNDDGRLIGTVTDGDIRRAVLAGLSLDMPVSELLRMKGKTAYPAPVTAPAGTSRSDLHVMAAERLVRQIPLIDAAGRVVDVFSIFHELAGESEKSSALILVGGKGTRLMPLTENIPKPMLPIAGKPALQHIIEGLKSAGVTRFHLATHHLPHMIQEHFGDGSAFGVKIDYLFESEPLGTAGALALLPEQSAPIFVMNGDIMTKIDFRAMLSFHREHHSLLTVGIRKYELQVPYGVVDCVGENVCALIEKPVHQWFVNAGIYLVEPSIVASSGLRGRYDMTQLIDRLLQMKSNIIAFPITEYWLDIGRPSDYEQAQTDMSSWN